jgi:uncharacterized membrane-anchored protein
VRQLIALESSLEKRTGKIVVGDGLATLNLPDGYRYLNAADAEKVLVRWGNPPGSQTLGMLYPEASGLFGRESWAVIVTYSEDGARRG